MSRSSSTTLPSKGSLRPSWVLAVRALLVCSAFLAISSAEAATYYSRASGNWNSTSSWSLVGYGGAASLSYPGQTGAGDIVFISGHTITLTATPPFAMAGITLNQLGVGAITKLDLNAAGTVLTCTSFTMLDNNVNFDMDLEVSSTARLQVNGPIQVTRGTTNTRSKRMRLYARTSGIINATGNFTYTYNRSGGTPGVAVQLDNNAQLNVGGNMLCTAGNNSTSNDTFIFQLNNAATCTVAGTTNFIVQNTTDGDNIFFDLNGGLFTSQGAMNMQVALTATGNSRFDAFIDGASLVANAGLALLQQQGSTFDMQFNSASTLTPASLTVIGDLVVTHNSGANDQTFLTNNNTTVFVQGNMALSMSDSQADKQYLDLNGGNMTVTGNLTSTIGGTGNGKRFLWSLDGAASLTVGADVIINQISGGPLLIYLNKNNGSGASLNIANDFIINHSAGTGRIEVDIDASSGLTVGRDMKVSGPFGNSNEYVYIAVRANTSLNVGRDLLLTMGSGTSAANDLIVRQFAGIISVGRDVVFTKGGGDEAYWNQDGGTTTVGRDFRFRSTGGDDCWLYMDGTSVLNVNGNMLFDMLNGDQARIWLNENAGTDARLNITGNFTINKLSPAGDVQFLQSRNSRVVIGGDFDLNHTAGADVSRYRLSNNTNSLSIGGNMNCRLLAGNSATDDIELDFLGGNVTVAGDVLWRLAAGDDLTATIKNQMLFLIGGDLTLDHPGGDDLTVDISSNGTELRVNGNTAMVDGAGGTTTTIFKMDNSSRARLLGNLTMTATTGAQVLLDMNASSYLYIKGSLIRSAAPSHFGSLTMSNTSIIEFNGTTEAQLMTDDAGNGGDSFYYANVVINNTGSVYPQVYTEGVTTINKDIQFQNGVLGTASTRRLVLANGGTSNGGNAGSFVNGPMKKIGGTDYIFPVGKNGFWARLGMVSLAAAGNNTEYDCEYFAAPSPNNSTPFYGPGIDHVSHVEHWSLIRTLDTGNDANSQVRLYWQNAARSSIILNSDLRVAGFRASNNKWNNHGGTGTGGASGSILSTTVVSEYGFITFASAGGLNPLPIELVSFTATNEGAMVRLDWSTASEHSNDYFTVERSTDNILYDEVLQKPSMGNSTSLVRYTDLDREPLEGWSYYRLKQTDLDGTHTYSDVVALKRSGAVNDQLVVAYPNPSMGELNIALAEIIEGQVDVRVIDPMGRTVLDRNFSMSGNRLGIETEQLPQGSYRILVHSEGRMVGVASWIKTGR